MELTKDQVQANQYTNAVNEGFAGSFEDWKATQDVVDAVVEKDPAVDAVAGIPVFKADEPPFVVAELDDGPHDRSHMYNALGVLRGVFDSTVMPAHRVSAMEAFDYQASIMISAMRNVGNERDSLRKAFDAIELGAKQAAQSSTDGNEPLSIKRVTDESGKTSLQVDYQNLPNTDDRAAVHVKLDDNDPNPLGTVAAVREQLSNGQIVAEPQVMITMAQAHQMIDEAVQKNTEEMQEQANLNAMAVMAASSVSLT